MMNYEPVPSAEPILTASYANEGTSLKNPNVQSMRLDQPSEPVWNDKGFAAFFLANAIAILYLAVTKGIPAAKSFVPSHEDIPLMSNYSHVLLLLGVISIGAFGVAMLWIHILLSFAENMIRIALWMNVGLLVASAFTTMVVNPFAPFIFLIMAAINVWYIYAVQNRIAFASANLKCACQAISVNKGIIAVSIFLAVKQMLWMILWSFAALGAYQIFRDADPDCAQHEKEGKLCGGGNAGVALFFLLVSLYWGQQVIQNVNTCTTAGTVASWWYNEVTSSSSNAVRGSFIRSCTTSFGSICFGSLLVAILQALQTMARLVRQKAQEEGNEGLACFSCLAECVLSCVEGIMEYINMWAFCYVGIYGYDFKSSGKAVMNLFKNRGWTAVINDDLTSNALGLGAFGVGLITCGAGLLVAKFSPEDWLQPLTTDAARYGTFAAYAFIAGFSMAIILSNVVTTALHTIFVCFAEDPVAFGRAHPDHYADLVAAWKQCHPDVWAVAYGQFI